MGAIADAAKAYLDGEITAEEFEDHLNHNIAVANEDQLKQLAEYLSKLPL